MANCGGRPNTVGSPWWVPVAATAVLAAAIGAAAICGEPPIRRLTPVESSASETGQPLPAVRPAAAPFPAAETIADHAETLEEAWTIAVQAPTGWRQLVCRPREAESLRCAAGSQRWPDVGLSSYYRVRQDELVWSTTVRAWVFRRSTIRLLNPKRLVFASAVTLPLYTSGWISTRLRLPIAGYKRAIDGRNGA